MIARKILSSTATAVLFAVGAPAFAQVPIDDQVVGNSEGNHRLDCTVVRPWAEGANPSGPFPVVGWTNGWGQGNVQGADQTTNYLPGLRYWAEEGEFLVIAANQWSPRAPDIEQCLQWLLDQHHRPDSKYYGKVATAYIGVAGHSQGGGAALKAGDLVLQDGPGTTRVSTVVAMNPYGPSFVKSRHQNGQIMLLGGALDGVTPTSSFSEVLENSILSEEQGGVQAEHIDGTHCRYACDDQFGEFGPVSLLWFQIMLADKPPEGACEDLTDILDGELYGDVWNTVYSDNFICAQPFLND